MATPSRSHRGKLLIIGGGILGITIARQAAIQGLFSEIWLLEKDGLLGQHATVRNSGVIHAGFYYLKDTNKARFCSEANHLLRKYCIENNVPVRRAGKVVVTRNQEEEIVLEELFQRGVANGCTLELLPKARLSEHEPLAETYQNYLWSPNTWSACPKRLLATLVQELHDRKVFIVNNAKVITAEKGAVIDQNGRRYEYDFMVNAAGGYALEVAKRFNLHTPYRLLPFKGLYLKSRSPVDRFTKHIYPVPDTGQPFLGIHTTLTSDGYLKLGPTAIPVLSPENYGWLQGLDLATTPDILGTQIDCFVRNSFGYRDLAFREFQYLFSKNIIAKAQELTSYELMSKDFEWNSPGIRPQLYSTATGKLEMDFVFKEKGNEIHLLNSISPAWTCSLRTAEFIVSRIEKYH